MNPGRQMMSSLLGSLGCMSMCTRAPDESKRIDNEIKSRLKKWNKEEAKVIKLLLLGTGESGKSTVTKQMKIIHIHGFTEEERKEKVWTIRKNIKDAILTILGGMILLGIKLENEEHQTSVDYINTRAVEEDFDFPQEFYDHVKVVWADAGVQESYSRAHEYQLIDSAKYFMEKVDTIRHEDYLPTDQDILRNRVITNTIHRIDFTVNDGKKGKVDFSLYDVGGQRGERRKWIQVFETVTAILFVLDSSCFDTVLREDHTKNRLVEAIETFEQVWNSKFLRNVSVLLFINKIDLLEEKISSGKSLDSLLRTLPEEDPYYDHFQNWHFWEGPSENEVKEFVHAFPSPHSPDKRLVTTKEKRKASLEDMIQWKRISEHTVNTAVFIKRLCLSILHSPSARYQSRGRDWHEYHTCSAYYTCAVDTDTIQKVFEGCKTVLISKHLSRIMNM